MPYSNSLYRENARHNLRLFSDAVAVSGGQLLVLSEANSYRAPTDSYLPDVRTYQPCDGRLLSFDDAYLMFRDMNQAYLEAAVEAGALTFDLAANLDPLLNGPNGGRYMYDQSHYTIEGSAEMARLLRSKLMEILSED